MNGPVNSSLSFVGTLPSLVNTVFNPAGAVGSVTVTSLFVQVVGLYVAFPTSSIVPKLIGGIEVPCVVVPFPAVLNT